MISGERRRGLARERREGSGTTVMPRISLASRRGSCCGVPRRQVKFYLLGYR
jgi:hypothetical protein